MPAYPIVRQVIAALREQQQRHGLRPSAVESIMQVRLLNRYYEHLVREKNKRKIVNTFRGGSTGNGSSIRSNSEDRDKYSSGFWGTFGSNLLEYFVCGTRHLRTGTDLGDIISGVFSPAVGIKISKRSVSPPLPDIRRNMLPHGTSSPLIRAMEKIGYLLNQPTTSWAYPNYQEPAEITAWVGVLLPKFFTRVYTTESFNASVLLLIFLQSSTP